MIIEVFHHRKPRSDSALKSFSQEIQDEIVQYAQGRSLREVQAWLQEKHHVKRALSTISDFLSWSRTIEQRYRNMGAVEALVAPLGTDGAESTDTPDLTPEELRAHARRYFLETIIHDCNVSAWHQSERIALKREEMDLKQQQLELKRQELELKREQFELKRGIHKRNSDELVVKTCNDPKIRTLSEADDISSSDKIKGISEIMFGDKDESQSNAEGGKQNPESPTVTYHALSGTEKSPEFDVQSPWFREMVRGGLLFEPEISKSQSNARRYASGRIELNQITSNQTGMHRQMAPVRWHMILPNEPILDVLNE
jgi:hypothetical protein